MSAGTNDGGAMARQPTQPTHYTTDVQQVLIAVKGAGDLATGVMHRLTRAGFAVMATELPSPTVVRRSVAFAEAIALGQMSVEEVTAPRATAGGEIRAVLAEGR